MNVPSALIRDRVLHPVLDARAENLQQRRLIHNPSEETDSIVEHLAELARTCTPEQRPHLRAVLDLLRELAVSNVREGQGQQTIAGVVDTLAADLRKHETLDRSGDLGVKSIARRLRKPLEDLVNSRSPSSKAVVEARAAVDAVLREVPSAYLIGNVSLRHELGVTRYTRLVELIQDRAA